MFRTHPTYLFHTSQPHRLPNTECEEVIGPQNLYPKDLLSVFGGETSPQQTGWFQVAQVFDDRFRGFRTHGLPPAAWPGRKLSVSDAIRGDAQLRRPTAETTSEEYECIRQNLWELWQMYDIQWQRHVFFKYALFVYWMLGRYLWGSHISKSWRPLRCSYMCKNGGESFDWEDWFLWTL